MLSIDSKLKQRIISYYEYVIKFGIALKPNDVVEIVGSSFIKEEIDLLKDLMYQSGASKVVITHNDGFEFEKEINEDWQSFLDRRIKTYEALVSDSFVRVTILSPFVSSITMTNSVNNYKNNVYRLKFVQDYFNQGTRKTTIAIPNIIWANKLEYSKDELWNKIIDYSLEESKLEKYREYLSSIKRLYFKSSLGTNIFFDLLGLDFLGKKCISKEGIEYEMNIPCLEICTSPYKYGVNGFLVASKPVNYKGHIYNNIRLEFKDGYLINSEGIADILDISKDLRYVGEVALVIPNLDEVIFYNTLLDENVGCHIALGNSLHINENTNSSNYHVDIVFGTADIECYGETNKTERIDILKNGRFVLDVR